MPAVQSAFGPIVEPGWPDLKGPDMGAKLLSGAYIMGGINAKWQEAAAKKQALTNQLASMSLKAQAMEQDNALNEKKFELSKMALEQRGDVGFWRADIAERRGELAREVAQNVVTNQQNKIDGNRSVMNAMTSLQQDGIGKDDPRYPDLLTQRVLNASPYADQSLIRQVLQSNINDYNVNANRRTALLTHQEKMLLDDVGSKLYGDPTLHQTGPIEDPSKFPEETTGGGWGLGPYGVPTYKKGEEKTGYQTGEVTYPSGESKQVRFKTTDLTDLSKRWKALQEAKKKQLPTYDMPSQGIYSKPATSPNERAQRILADESETPERREAARFWLEQHQGQ